MHDLLSYIRHNHAGTYTSSEMESVHCFQSRSTPVENDYSKELLDEYIFQDYSIYSTSKIVALMVEHQFETELNDHFRRASEVATGLWYTTSL